MIINKWRMVVAATVVGGKGIFGSYVLMRCCPGAFVSGLGRHVERNQRGLSGCISDVFTSMTVLGRGIEQRPRKQRLQNGLASELIEG